MSGLEDLYREIILDHYRSPRNRGELETPPTIREEGFNPLCGDEVVVYLELDGDVVRDIAISGQGCSISQSSASMMSAAVKGKNIAEVRSLLRRFKTMMTVDDGDAEPEPVDPDSFGELAALQGVVKFPVRIKSATLSWNTLDQVLQKAEASG